MAYVADAAAQQIVIVQGLGGVPSATTLVSSGAYISDPAGLVLSAKGDRLFLANHLSTTIYEFDSTSGALLSQMLAEEAPRSLVPGSAGRFFLEPAKASSLVPSSRPVLLLDTSEPARVLFIPRGR
jgi:DNA-binding beta-propeller fold protein YncE